MRAGYQRADAVAALLVAVLVLAAAVRLMRGNVDVLMDNAPAAAEEAARLAIMRSSRRWSCAGCECARPAGGSSPTS